MKVWPLAIVVLLTAVLAAAFALRPPIPLPADASPLAFSATRAMGDVRAIAVKPHPAGSAALMGVQGHLLGRMAAMGLSPEARPYVLPKGEGQNLLGVLLGADRSAPAVLLMAHADSVKDGPGAADDAAGVAAVLEIVRALQASGPLKRDVMVLITDGEETCLCGSEAFFGADPARARVGVAINLEARGNRGRAVMFETHRGAGALIGALNGASGLMPDLYRRLPNDTDLTPALRSGKAGLNFAFFDGLDAYHRAADTAAALDPASLQSIGQQALAAARALAGADSLPGRAPDQVYADVMGGPVLQYPVAAGWALLVLAVAGVAATAAKAVQDGEASPAGLALGALAFLLLILLVGGVLTGEGELRAALAGYRLRPLLAHADILLLGAGCMALGAGLVWLWSMERWLRPASLELGALILAALLAAAVQAAAPLDAFILVWPLMVMVVGRILGPLGPAWLAPLFTLAALVQVLYWAGLLYPLMGQTLPASLTPFAALTAMTLLPLAPRTGRRTGLAGSALILAGLGLSLGAVVV